MKKTLAILLILPLLLSAAARSAAEDEEEDEGFLTSGDWEYVLLEDGTAEIAGYIGYDTEVAVPAELDGLEVSGLWEGMTFPWYAHISRVEIPDSVRKVEQNPFLYCDALTLIVVSPDHPTLAVEEGVLFDKEDRRLISYPLTKTGTAYAVPEGTERIGALAFSANKALETVTIPGSVTEIGVRAFSECENLAEVSLAEGLAAIGEGAFDRCAKLTGITLPDSLTILESNPFTGCAALETICVSADHPALEVKGGVLFSRTDRRLVCYPCGLKSKKYEVPKGTEAIGDFAFHRNPRLTAVVIPDGVVSVGVSAFCWCEKLKSVNIPDSVATLDEYAFVGCKAVTVTLSRKSPFVEILKEQGVRLKLRK